MLLETEVLSTVQLCPSAAHGMTLDSSCLLWPPAAPVPAKKQQQAVTSHNTYPHNTEAYLERDYSNCKLYGAASVWEISIGGESGCCFSALPHQCTF